MGENEGGRREDEDIPTGILLAWGMPAMTYSQTQHPYVTPLLVFSPFRARPPVHPLPVVRLVGRPYFFVPRNYSSQITGPGCTAENL